MAQKQKKKYSLLAEIAELEKKHLRKKPEKKEKHSHPNYPKHWSEKKKEDFHKAAQAQAKEEKEFEKKVKETFPDHKEESPKCEEKVSPKEVEKVVEEAKASYTPPEIKPSFTTQAEGVKLGFGRAEDLKKFVQSVNYVKEGRGAEGNLQVSKVGISLMRMDPSSISMVTADMPNKAFPRYEVKKEGKLGLNLDALKQAVKDVKKDESAELVQEGDKLMVRIIGPWNAVDDKATIRETVLPLLDIPKSVEKEPKLELPVHAEVNAKTLKDSLGRAADVSNYAKIELKDNTLMITAKTHEKEFKEEYAVKGHGEAYAQYNLEFLRGILKAANKDSTVSLDLKTQEPLRVEYQVADENARYWLAPYLED